MKFQAKYETVNRDFLFESNDKGDIKAKYRLRIGGGDMPKGVIIDRKDSRFKEIYDISINKFSVVKLPVEDIQYELIRGIK